MNAGPPASVGSARTLRAILLVPRFGFFNIFWKSIGKHLFQSLKNIISGKPANQSHLSPTLLLLLYFLLFLLSLPLPPFLLSSCLPTQPDTSCKTTNVLKNVSCDVDVFEEGVSCSPG